MNPRSGVSRSWAPTPSRSGWSIKTRPGEQWAIMRELRLRLHERFQAEGLSMPFTQRTVLAAHPGRCLRGQGRVGGSFGRVNASTIAWTPQAYKCHG